jgi:AcrR family transcriptional regulator
MDKKQILQKTALEIFVNKGFINTPVRDIIDESGLGTSTFYRNFKNKEDVLKSLLDDFLMEILLTIENYYKTENDLKKTIY